MHSKKSPPTKTGKPKNAFHLLMHDQKARQQSLERQAAREKHEKQKGLARDFIRATRGTTMGLAVEITDLTERREQFELELEAKRVNENY